MNIINPPKPLQNHPNAPHFPKNHPTFPPKPPRNPIQTSTSFRNKRPALHMKPRFPINIEKHDLSTSKNTENTNVCANIFFYYCPLKLFIAKEMAFNR